MSVVNEEDYSLNQLLWKQFEIEYLCLNDVNKPDDETVILDKFKKTLY